MRNAVTIAEADGEIYYSQYLQGTAEIGANSGQKDIMVVDNGCGFSGRKDGLYLNESGESLRAILSDPLTWVFLWLLLFVTGWQSKSFPFLFPDREVNLCKWILWNENIFNMFAHKICSTLSLFMKELGGLLLPLLNVKGFKFMTSHQSSFFSQHFVLAF